MKVIDPDIKLFGPEITKAQLRGGAKGTYIMQVSYLDGVNTLTPTKQPPPGIYNLVLRNAMCCNEYLVVSVPGCPPHKTESSSARTPETNIPTCE